MTTLCYCFYSCTADGVCIIGDLFDKRSPTLVINLKVKVMQGKPLTAVEKISSLRK